MYNVQQISEAGKKVLLVGEIQFEEEQTLYLTILFTIPRKMTIRAFY